MTDHQQAAIEAAAKQHSPHLWDGRFRAALLRTKYFTSEQADEGVEKNRAEILAEAEEYITAAEPHLRKKVRAEVAAEIRASLPRDLAASAQDLDGWFSDMTGDLNIVVEVDEDMTPVGYGFELEAATGTIDLHLLADIAARIAEGEPHDGM